jgi:hypothetical protein
MAYTNINKSSDYFNTKLWSGNSSTQSITGVGFQPDLVWIKNRNTGDSHNIQDVITGVSKILRSDTTTQVTGSDRLTSFDADGFSLGSNVHVNASSYNYQSWNWLGSGTGVSNTDGSKTSTVSANQTSGFSVVRWVGVDGTVGHGLNAVPEMIIVKNTDDATNWFVYHKTLGNSKYLNLNTTSAETTNSSQWNNTSPTSSVFTVGSSFNNANYIAYCFAEKKGFSKFGSYVGNGSTDGTFVYTGFKPAFVLVKNTAITDNWSIFDNKRIGYNAFNYVLYADITNVGSNGLPMDILSNGFKWRTDAGMVNGSGQNHIYMAFAEEPLVGTNGVPATAR